MESSRQALAQEDLQPGDVQADGSQAVYDVASMPGFRFQPTEEELVGFYLRSMVIGKPRLEVELINVLDLYRYDPWELPAMAFMQGEREWLFFCPRDKKYPNGARPNRVTASGYWKATGTDRQVRRAHDARCIGLKKTLVFYTGKAPKGRKTEWIMNEYRLPQNEQHLRKPTNLKDPREVALCRIYKKPAPNPSTATLQLCADLMMEEPLGAESSTYTPESSQYRDPGGGLERDSIREQPCASTSCPTSPSTPKFVTFSPNKRPVPVERDAICATEPTTANSQHDCMPTSTCGRSCVKTEEMGTLSSVLYPCLATAAAAPESVDSIDALLAQLMDAEAAARRGGRPQLFLRSPPASQITVATPAGAVQHELTILPGDHVANHVSDDQAGCCSTNVSPTLSTLDRLLKASSMWSSSPVLAMHDDLLPVSSSSFFSMNQFGWNYGTATHEPPWLLHHPSAALPARQSLLQIQGLQDHFQY